MPDIKNTRIKQLSLLLPSPRQLTQQLPASESIKQQVIDARKQIHQILQGEDPRLILVVGPCSIHDPEAALEYARELKKIADSVSDRMLILMRTYFEKPRTNLGWTGLINDPQLDGSNDMASGLKIARQLLLDINGLGLPTATEWLDTMIPQYLSDLISWSAIGARTTESQIHRHMASGLSMAVGFKNTTSGNIASAIDAVKVAQNSHRFLGINSDAQAIIAETSGNPDCHIILRGGSDTGPNYKAEHIAEAQQWMQAKNISAPIMIDCSHGNSHKDHRQQKDVVDYICQQLMSSDQAEICGLMLESHLKSGKQDINAQPLQYGVSITDSCIDLAETKYLVEQLHQALEVELCH